MATLFTETFTGSNGTAPAHLVLGRNASVGGVADIQGNRLHLGAGTQGSYNANDRVNRALSADSSTPLQIADQGIRFTAVFDTNESYFGVVLRCAQLAYAGGNGYDIQFDQQNSTIKVTKGVSFVYTTIATLPFTFTAGTTYYLGASIVGTAIKVFCSTGAQSSTPVISITDNALTGTGYLLLNIAGGGSAGVASYVYIDDLVATDGATNQTKLLTASVTPSGTIRRSGLAKKLSGQTVPTGGIFRLRNPQFPDGSVTPSGGIVRRVFLKNVGGTVTPTATYRALALRAKALAGSVTPTGPFRKTALKRPAGSVTPTHSPQPRKFFKPLRGTVVSTATLVRAKAGRVFGRAGTARMTLRKVDTQITFRRRHDADLTVEQVSDAQLTTSVPGE